MKTYIILSHSGIEVIDNTPEAENRIAIMEYFEERYKREHRRRKRNLLYKLACVCGIL